MMLYSCGVNSFFHSASALTISLPSNSPSLNSTVRVGAGVFPGVGSAAAVWLFTEAAAAQPNWLIKIADAARAISANDENINLYFITSSFCIEACRPVRVGRWVVKPDRVSNIISTQPFAKPTTDIKEMNSLNGPRTFPVSASHPRNAKRQTLDMCL